MLGYLWNPLNMNLTAGGSSGGEGAIAAFRRSASVVGTDSDAYNVACFASFD
jgi:Asp-tRNA(Asn)/Glu-tRNA(Gln) amidotransferase A subunit family amidase